MRAELPWNVAGIPPEAREAARAAARREGLSVGEWLTRRILQDLSDLASLGDDESVSAKRRDTEEMLARLAEAEAEATSSYRRIEQHLRLVGTDYDNAERSQSESNRAMSRAANEIHTAGREQAEAFDQLGRHVTGLSERVDRLERSSAQEGLKEAVKGLHQGLTRLASELGQATGRSGVQIASLARNLEQLALRVVAARGDADNALKLQDGRLAVLEEANHVTADAIDRALEKLDDVMAERAAFLADAETRERERQEALERIETRLGRIEARADDQTLADRLEEVEQSLSQLVASLERDTTAELEDALAQLAARLETVEKNHQGMLLDLSARLSDVAFAVQLSQRPVPETAGSESTAGEPPSAQPADEDGVEDTAAFAGILSSPENDGQSGGLEHDRQESDNQENDRQETAEDIDEITQADDVADDAFATHFKMPKELADELAQVLAHPSIAIEPERPQPKTPAEEENFLREARLSAIAASEEDAQGLHFFLRRPEREGGGTSKRPLFIAIALLLLLGGGAALVVGLRLGQHPQPVKAAQLPHKTLSKPAPEPKPAPTPAPAASPAAPAMDATPAIPPATSSSSDKLPAAGEGGDPRAWTIMGLRYLDGEVSDPAKAAPWLEKAAAQGQPVAQYRLGTLYERGQGVPENAALAVKWYLAAAGQGNRKAMHNLAVAYANGAAGPKNMAEAARWFAKAAALGLSDSQFNLAVLYERGDGVPQSLADAYKWYAIAAAQGDAESKARLSVLETQLSAQDRDAAERAAKGFRPLTLDPVANLPPQDLRN